MVPRPAREAASKPRGYQGNVSQEQEREMENVMERLGLWPNKQSFLREAVNDKLAWAWAMIAARDAASVSNGEDAPRSLHDVEREPED